MISGQMRRTGRPARAWRRLVLAVAGAIPALSAGGCFFALDDVRAPVDAAPELPVAAPGQPQTLAIDQRNPFDIAVDADWVYWSATDGLYRVRKQPTSTDPWFHKLLDRPNFALRLVALDATSVYVADTAAGQVLRVGKDGRSPTVIATGNRPFAVAVDERNVYFTCSGDGTLQVVPKPGPTSGAPTPPRVLARSTGTGDEDMWGLALDAENVYWADAKAGKVFKMAKVGGPGGAPMLLATRTARLYALALDDTNVFFREGDNGAGKVLAVPKAGGAAVELQAQRQQFPRGIAADASGVYWTGGPPTDSRVDRIDRDGSNYRSIATGLSNAHSVALDATSVYWTNWGGATIMRAPK